MTSDIETYMKDVVDDQIDWHDKKAIFHQKRYKKRIKLITLMSLLIPIVSILNFDSEILMLLKDIIIALLGAAISFLTYTLNLDKDHKNWIDYRNTCEALKREKQLYLFSVGKYSDIVNKDTIFVQTTQDILNKQNINWTTSAKVPVTNSMNNI